MLQERAIAIGNKKYIYLESDNSIKLPILLLLHGWNDRAASWSVLTDLLEKKYHLIIPNLPGFGGSDDLGKYEIRDYAEWIIDFVHEKKLSSSLYLLGHSLGGIITAYLSRNYQDVFKKAIALNAPIFLESYVTKPLSQFRKILRNNALPKKKEIIANIEKGHNLWIKYTPHFISENIGIVKRLETTTTAYVELVFSILTYDFMEDYPDIKDRFLFIFGTTDPFWQGLKKETKVTLLSNSFVLPGAHAIWMFQEKKLVEAIDAFFLGSAND